jgi:hypothetical protein
MPLAAPVTATALPEIAVILSAPRDEGPICSTGSASFSGLELNQIAVQVLTYFT